MSYGFKVMVTGDWASFNRPEFKVERVSYDVPTPGAVEGLIKSIYWKPAIRYVVDKIIVFNPIKFTNIRRNEVKEKLKLQHVQNNMNNGTDCSIYTKDMINQRGAMILKDVCYGFEFHFELTGIRNEHDDESEEKHYNILLRRLSKGQCFRQPVLGCREFPIRSIELVDDFNLDDISDTLKGDIDLDICFIIWNSRMVDILKMKIGIKRSFLIRRMQFSIGRT